MRHHIKQPLDSISPKVYFVMLCARLKIGSNTLSQALYREVYLEVEFYVVSQLREMCMLWCRSRKGAASFFMSTVEKTCSCFGHSDVDITDDLIARTRIEIGKAIEDSVRIFLFGGRSDFDDLCYDLVTEKKNDNPQLNIKRVFCFALDKQLRKPPRWYVPKEYEALECPTKDFDYWYTAIYYRNLAMIDQSDLILFWVEERENSGAYKTYRYAVKKHKRIVNLFTRNGVGE